MLGLLLTECKLRIFWTPEMSNPNVPHYPTGPQQGAGYSAPGGYATQPGYAPSPPGYAPAPDGYSAVPTQYPPPGMQQYPPPGGNSYAFSQPQMGQYYNPNEQGNGTIALF